MNEQKIQNAINSLKKLEKNAQTLDDYLDIAYEFRFNNDYITPIQIREELKEFLLFGEKLSPKIILEIGTATGGTLYSLCKIAHPSATIISIDLPEGEFGGELFQDWKIPLYKEFSKKEQKMYFIREDSHDEKTFSEIKQIIGEQKIDLLLIDGDHRYEGVKQDYMMYSKLVNDNGLIVFHDINQGEKNEVGEVPKFWNEIKKEKIFAEIVNYSKEKTGYGIGIIVKNGNDEINQKLFQLHQENLKLNLKYFTQIQTKITKTSLGALLTIYTKRQDLQEKFPEVKEGKISDLIAWALNIESNDDEKIEFEKIKPFKNSLQKIQKILKNSNILDEKILEVKSELESEKKRSEEVKSELESELESEKKRSEEVKSELESELESEKKRSEEVKSELESEKKFVVKELEEIKNSEGWKFIQKFRIILQNQFPVGTRKRKILDRIVVSLLKTKNQYKSHRPEIKSSYHKWKQETERIQKEKTVEKIPKKEISIIIPIHNGSKVAIPCIESVIKNTTFPYELILVNDASSEEKMLEYFANIKNKNIKIINNEKNIGYVKSINKAINSSNNDIVLLNSDTIVTKKWLNKLVECVYSNKKIASASPLSNNATICSIPEFTKENEIPKNYTIEEFATFVEELSEKKFPPSPTCPGFCLFIKRTAIQDAGIFDEQFSPAYAEEDDLCMRLHKKGYLTVIDDDTFVFHHGEKSYNEKSQKLKDEHMKLLLKKHPEYLEIVSGFCANDPLRQFRENLKSKIRTIKTKPSILVLVHRPIYAKNAGGTELFCKSIFEPMNEVNRFVMYPENNQFVVDEFTENGIRTIFTINREKRNSNNIEYTEIEKEIFADILNELNIDIVHVHHTLDLPMNFIHIAKELQRKVIISIHDFYLICPTVFLFENGDVEKFCFGCTDMKRCNNCLESLNIDIKQEKWRSDCSEILKNSDLIISPSQSVQNIFAKTYSLDENKMKVIHHGFDYITSDKKNNSDNKLKIGYIGAVQAPRKGKELILKLLKENPNEEIEWHFFGGESDLSEFIDFAFKGKTIFHGRYSNEAEIPKMLNENGIDLVILPSMETFSIVLSEVWAAKIPVIVPDITALGERVKKTGGGWVIPYPCQVKEILKILEEIKDKSKILEKQKKIEKIKLKTEKECVNNYVAIYKEMTKIVKEF